MKRIQNTGLHKSQIKLSYDSMAGLSISEKDYDKAKYLVVEAFFDEDFKKRVTLGAFSMYQGVITEKFRVDEIEINGEPFDPKEYLITHWDKKPAEKTVLTNKTAFDLKPVKKLKPSPNLMDE